MDFHILFTMGNKLINWFFDHINAITSLIICMIPILLGGTIGALLTTKPPEANELEGFSDDKKQ